MPKLNFSPWKKGEIIREKTTGKPYLVIHVFTNIATLIADTSIGGLQVPLMLLQRDYRKYQNDAKMEFIETGSFSEPDIIRWYEKQTII